MVGGLDMPKSFSRLRSPGKCRIDQIPDAWEICIACGSIVPMTKLQGLKEVEDLLTGDRSAGKGFDRVFSLKGNTYRDQSTIVIVPSREEMFHHRITTGIHGMISPMNQRRYIMFCVGDEVGVAYNRMITSILGHPELSAFRYVMTVESDNLVPHDAHLRLLETIEAGMWDAVSGLYFTKGELNMPMAYGDPARYEATGVLEFTPRDVSEALASGKVMPVNGIAMGCALWRMDLFRQVPQPWFVTLADVVDGKYEAMTQDLYFCREARKRGHRFAVDCRVKVGHMDLVTGEVY